MASEAGRAQSVRADRRSMPRPPNAEKVAWIREDLGDDASLPDFSRKFLEPSQLRWEHGVFTSDAHLATSTARMQYVTLSKI